MQKWIFGLFNQKKLEALYLKHQDFSSQELGMLMLRLRLEAM
jgi:hypothetical protein